MMMDDLNRRLAAAAEEWAKLEKLRRQAARLEAEQREASSRAQELREALAKEERDVERLESSSLSALLASFLGNKEERLYQEREEAATALVRYQEARERADLGELRAITAEMAGLSGAEGAYQSLLAQKEGRLRSEQGTGADELLRLDRTEQEAQDRLREIEEAERAGRKADLGLAQVISALQSAQGWGTWDMLGGGWIATMAKHSRMDEAQSELHAAQQALGRFRRELADVGNSVQLPSVDLDGFTRFADYFFDGLLVDWIVQSRINEAIRLVEEARGQVGNLLRWLQHQAAAAKFDLEQVRTQRAQYIAEHP